MTLSDASLNIRSVLASIVASALSHSQDSQTCLDIRYWAMALGDGAMAQQVCVVLSTAERERLAAIAADRNRPRKHVERARIVLASADRHSAQRVRKASASAGRRYGGGSTALP